MRASSRPRRVCHIEGECVARSTRLARHWLQRALAANLDKSGEDAKDVRVALDKLDQRGG